MGDRTTQKQRVRLSPHLSAAAERSLYRAEDVRKQMLEQGLPSTYVGISEPRMAGLQQAEQIAGPGSMVPQTFLPEYQKVMSGGYLDAASNPYLQDIVNRSVSAATSPIMGMGAGRFGGGVYANALADTAASTASRLYGAQYEAERQRMQQMAGLSPMAYGMQYADADTLQDIGRQYEADELAQRAEAMRQFQFPATMQDWYSGQLGSSPFMQERDIRIQQPFDWMGMVGGILNPMKG